jgi:hypothetical protein
MFCAAWAKAVDQTDDAAAGAERLGQKNRQHRIEHLGGDVGKQAGEGEKEGGPRKAGKIGADGSSGHVVVTN